MSWTDQVIFDFGRSIGIQNLHLDPKLGIRLGFENDHVVSILSLEKLPIPEILISCSIHGHYARQEIFFKALQLSHFNFNPSFTTQWTINEIKYTKTIRIPERSFSESSLEKSIDNLLKSSNIFSQT